MTTRVYQLADELGLSKFELIDAINSLDLEISVENVMSALTPEEVAKLKRALKLEAFDPEPLIGVWRLRSLTYGTSHIAAAQSHLVIQEQRLWPVRPTFADYISKHPEHGYQIEWDDDVGRLTVTRSGEESYYGLVRIDGDELRIRWAKDTSGKFPRSIETKSLKSGGNLAIYAREPSSEVSQQLLAGALLPEPWELTYQAIDLCDQGSFEEAIELFDRALELDPHHAQACYERAMARMSLGEREAALEDFGRALEIDEHFPGAREWRARCLKELGESEEAAHEWLEVARDEAVETFTATTPLASTSEPSGVDVSPQTWADCATAFIEAGKPDKAAEVLEEYLTEYESKVTTYEHYKPTPLRILAGLRLDEGDVEAARALAERAYAHENRSPAETFTYARALEAAGDLDQAREKLAEMPDYEGSWPELSEMRERLGE